MKTKQRLLSLALALLLALALTACGSSSTAAAPRNSPAMAKSETAAASGSDLGAAAEAKDVAGSAAAGETPAADKVIYNASADIETLDFDKSLSDLQQLLDGNGGFVQSSNVSGSAYQALSGGTQGRRRADYTVRIPADKFKTVFDNLGVLGNLVSRSTSSQDVTLQYHDTQSHLDACRTKEARLLALLSKAANMNDIIALENALSDVRYQIESLSSQIENWDSQISYSTLTISLSEVSLYTEKSPSSVSYGTQLKAAFHNSLQGVGSFFLDFFKFLVGASPVLAVLAVLALIILFTVKAARGRKRRKAPLPGAEEKSEDPPAQQ